MAINTVLLDLDDTLLRNSTEHFLPAYMFSLSNALTDFAPAEEIVSLVMNAIQAMQDNANPTITNEDAFYAHFLTNLKRTRNEIQPTIDRYYKTEYPKLKGFVHAHPNAQSLVSYLFRADYRVIIATNPLFPKVAVMQRLAWAEVADFPYTLVTSMENAHFSKPDPKYYQEILDQFQLSPDEVIMVGDDADRDIAPAKSIGIATWHITENGDSAQSGPLDAFHQWLLDGGLKHQV